MNHLWILCFVLPLMRGGNPIFGYPLSLGEDSEIYWKDLDFVVLPWMSGGNQTICYPLSLAEEMTADGTIRNHSEPFATSREFGLTKYPGISPCIGDTKNHDFRLGRLRRPRVY